MRSASIELQSAAAVALGHVTSGQLQVQPPVHAAYSARALIGCAWADLPPCPVYAQFYLPRLLDRLRQPSDQQYLLLLAAKDLLAVCGAERDKTVSLSPFVDDFAKVLSGNLGERVGYAPSTIRVAE